MNVVNIYYLGRSLQPLSEMTLKCSLTLNLFCVVYKQMKGDNLSNQMIKFYNSYSSLTIPRSIWLHYVGTCDPHSRASFDPMDII